MSQQARRPAPAPCAGDTEGQHNSSLFEHPEPGPASLDPMAQALARVVSHYIEACRRL
jgi:hypothetical protein